MVKTSAYDFLKKHELHHILHIFGLEDVAKVMKVTSEEPEKAQCDSIYIPKQILERDPKEAAARIVDELVYKLGGTQPAFYAYSRVHALLGKKKVDYRELMRKEESKKERSISKIAGSAIFGVPLASIALGELGLISDDTATGIAVLSGLVGFQLAAAGFGGLEEMYHDPKERAKVRYLRWLLKRGIKKGIKPNREGARDFIKGRMWELNLREGLPEKDLKNLSPEDLAIVLPYLQGEKHQIAERKLKEALLKALKEMKSKNPIKRWRATRRYRNALLAGAVKIPENFFDTKFYKKVSEQKTLKLER